MKQNIKNRIDQIKNGQVPEGYEKTDFGVFPIDWEKSSIGKISIGNGIYGINAAACDYDPSLPKYIRITDINDDGQYKDNGACVDDEDSKDYILKKNDLVLVRTGASVGKSYLYKENDGKLVYAGFLIKFSINSNKANPYYMYANCNTQHYWNWVTKVCARSGQPGINAEEYSQYTYYSTMDIYEQAKIAEILMKWDEAVELQEQYIQKLEIRKKALMQKLLTPKDGWNVKSIGEIATKQKGRIVDFVNNGKYPVLDMEFLMTGVVSYKFA